MHNNSKEKISIIAPNLSGKGGTETVITYLLDSKIINSKYDLKIMVTGNNCQTPWLKKHINKKNVYVIKSDSKLIKLIRSIVYYAKNNSDFILSTGPGQTLISSIVKKILKKKYKIISWIHFSVFGATNIKYKYLKYADYHLTISKQMEEQLNSLGIDKKNIKTIYNPVEKQNQIIKRSNEFIKKFIYVGRIQLNDQKNLSEMLLGLSHLKLKWKLDIYGDGEIDKVSDLAYKLNILDNIQFHGWVMNPWIKMKNVDALLLTSTYEGFGMVLAEAISRGIPCISSDCPVGPSDIILNGVNGYLYKMGDIDDFINNVYSVVSNEQFNDTTQIIESLKNYYSPKYDENFLNSIASFK